MTPGMLFKVQLAMSCAGLALCAGMLATGRDPALYLPVVTSIVGYWMPAPRRADAPPPPPTPVPSAASSIASVNNGGCCEDDELRQLIGDFTFVDR